MIIGLISDTHGYLDPLVARYFEPCHEIWHAGDVGDMQVLDSLKALKPTFAVYGNIDGLAIRQQYPEDLWLERQGLRVLITHIAGRPGRYEKRIKPFLMANPPHLLVCGHSHILKVVKDKDFNDMWYINPGAAGRQGMHRIKTIMRMTLGRGKITNLEVIELGKRGALDPVE